MSVVVGIDLGTTNSCVAFINSAGNAEVIPNREGGNITPSVAQFNMGQFVVGSVAKKEMVLSPETTISFAKRYMHKADELDFSFEGTNYSAIDISAIILKKLIQDSEEFLNSKIDAAVITVPAYFDVNAKQATLQAAEIAGIEVLQLIMEPSSAALYYSYKNENKLDNKRILVFDLGGGTFDVSVIDLSNGTTNVVSTGGDPALGGKDIDESIIELFKKMISDDFPEESINYDDIEIVSELYDTAEEVKKMLSQKSSVNLKFRFLKKFKRELTREQFEEQIAHLVEDTMVHVANVIKQVDDNKGIDEVILVGGSTRSPIFEKAIEKTLNIKPLKNVNPDEVVAQGAAVLAKKLTLSDDKTLSEETKAMISKIELKDIVPQALGFLYYDGLSTRNKVLISHGSQVPCVETIVGYGFSGSSAEFKLTQGDSDEPELVEIIGRMVTYRDSNNLGERTQVEITIEYQNGGTIKATCLDLTANKKYELEVRSDNILSSNELMLKKQEISKAIIE